MCGFLDGYISPENAFLQEMFFTGKNFIPLQFRFRFAHRHLNRPPRMSPSLATLKKVNKHDLQIFILSFTTSGSMTSFMNVSSEKSKQKGLENFHLIIHSRDQSQLMSCKFGITVGI